MVFITGNIIIFKTKNKVSRFKRNGFQNPKQNIQNYKQGFKSQKHGLGNQRHGFQNQKQGFQSQKHGLQNQRHGYQNQWYVLQNKKPTVGSRTKERIHGLRLRSRYGFYRANAWFLEPKAGFPDQTGILEPKAGFPSMVFESNTCMVTRANCLFFEIPIKT